MFKSSRVVTLKEGLQFENHEFDALPQVQKDAVTKALQWEGQGFDIRVHIVEPKSGILLKYQPYRRVCSLADGVCYYRKDEKGIERRYTEQGHPMDKFDAPKEKKSA